MHADQSHAGYGHVADKHLKCLLVSEMEKEHLQYLANTFICFEIYLVIWDLFVWLML